MLLRLPRIARLAVAVACGVGCDQPRPDPVAEPVGTVEPSDTGEPFDYVYPVDGPWLPAYRRFLSVPEKADQYDDRRWNHPERHAITVPPSNIATVRPMVEWEPMRAIVLQWPGAYVGFADGATSTAVEITRNALNFGEVWFVTDQGGDTTIINRLLQAGITQTDIDDQVRFLIERLDAIWLVDFGPLPIIDEADGTFAFADFRYYHERPLDDGIPTALGRGLPRLGFERPATVYRMPVDTEGGTFQSTSDGICFTGDRQLFYMTCLAGDCQSSVLTMPLDQVQSHPSALELKRVWGEYLGCRDVIVTNSVTDDGTGHVDMYLKVLDDERVLIGEYVAPFQSGTAQAANAQLLDENAAFIEAYVKPAGGRFAVPRLIMPGHRSTNQGRVPFTYMNSTFFNGLNLWPAYLYTEWEESRAEAEATWHEVLPEYTHVWIESAEISFWAGAIHCITRTIPERVPGQWVEDGDCTGELCDAAPGGYSGECSPNGLTDTICWGPEWACDCNDCSTGCDYAPAGPVDVDCPDGLTDRGCCEDDTLRYCEFGTQMVQPCTGGCGWSSAGGFYNCGDARTFPGFPGEPDPGGTHPLSCEEAICVADCSGRHCGSDGCGGLCGLCGIDDVCLDDGSCLACPDACDSSDDGCEGYVRTACVSQGIGCPELSRFDCRTRGHVCIDAACVDPVSVGLDSLDPVDLEPDPESDPQAQPRGGDVASGCSGAGRAGSPRLFVALSLLGLALTRRRRRPAT